ncbi:PilZ domain-containing protein [Altererythrobacter sp. Root672]|uniref:PilZ domain-containing protein n=1 Tax=Altererythrobacter sp. Root672 TaxID=1736584 RepID=UPI0006F36855|nr:PilZ domain-containing protein [Altererythrobacter sp. Root672]KRA82942.1 hypothetical protein ASD76_02325 [Altererythrobacter sp. Root672]
MSINRRRADRYSVQVSAKLKEELGKPHTVLVTNLSWSGCRLSSSHTFKVGTPVSLEVGRADPLEGRVKWRVGAMHGVRFARPLDPTLLDHIRLFLSAQPSVVAERVDGSEAA